MSAMSFDETSRILDDAGGALHYHEAGSGEVLLLLHGSGPGVTGWANFGRNLPFFAERFRTIILDLPGYGKSAPVDGLPVPAAVDAVRRFLDGMGIEKAHILGNSYGGIVGGQFAAAYPDRVRRFVTIGGIGVWILSTFPAEGLTRLVDFVEQPSRERLVQWLESMVFDKSILTEELMEMRWKSATDPVTMETSKKMYTRQALEAIAAFNRGPDAAQGFAYLPKIKAPTLIAWGRDDRVNPLDGALVPMRLIPNAELHVFPNCGHWAMIERKAEFENVVMAFLTRD
ncbi:alpha/beta fold hydrolase [Sphingomonas sp. MM-1]|nr:alpha/beta fold hydrolase [Sphingomonas sp. MM-1]OHT20816.1 4,5:9,10-diseco-3-hydroxy-5,9,17-trioxoandrosta-1(10),2-diene-4-oate hydrolase [Sphingomonas haloaromaticamans]